MDKGRVYTSDKLPVCLENDLINLLKAIYHENHKVDRIIHKTQVTLHAKFSKFQGEFTHEEKVQWLVRSGICYRRANFTTSEPDSQDLDLDTLENLMFNFGKCYTDSEIQIALDNLGTGRFITAESLALFLEDEVFEIESGTTLTKYDLPRKSRKSITLERLNREKSLSRISSSVRRRSVEYQDSHGQH